MRMRLFMGLPGFGTGFAVFQILFTVVFVLVVGMFILVAVKGIRQWNRNNHAPRLTVPATVVAKRSDVSHHRQVGTGMHHTMHATTYFATFQVESGDRIELRMAGYEFGMLVEGDRGKLSFQGTRYLGFERLPDVGV